MSLMTRGKTAVVDGSTTAVLPLVIKDIHGNKAFMSIWPNHKAFGSITENHVYYMENIKTGKYPDIKPHSLNSKWGFKLVEASDEISKKFSQIGYIDGTITGNILGGAYTKADTVLYLDRK